jgi:hypothetical protein
MMLLDTHSQEARFVMKAVVLILTLTALGSASSAWADPPGMEAPTEWLTSLITETPAEGFALAVRLARRGVTTTQPDKSVLMEQRPRYAADAADLIAASHVVAVHFQTIAKANNHWRD